MIVTLEHDRRFVDLVHSFPVLGGRASLAPAPGVGPLSVDLLMLDRWAAGEPDAHTDRRGPFPGDGAKEAARFVLNLWSSRHAWKCGRFDLFLAFRVWDEDQISAFRLFVLNPFLP